MFEKEAASRTAARKELPLGALELRGPEVKREGVPERLSAFKGVRALPPPDAEGAIALKISMEKIKVPLFFQSLFFKVTNKLHADN